MLEPGPFLLFELLWFRLNDGERCTLPVENMET